jgi:hypothetical protein
MTALPSPYCCLIRISEGMIEGVGEGVIEGVRSGGGLVKVNRKKKAIMESRNRKNR